jgi:transposase InsO family protein
MAAHETEFSVKRMAQVLGVSRSGYYAWRDRPVSAREQANQDLLGRIEKEFQLSRRTYGSPRIHARLHRQGVACGHNRVARLMRVAQLTPPRKRKWRPQTTRRDPRVTPAPNRLAQDFSAAQPNRKWVTDITYIETAEGWLYLAGVLDLFSRRVVGWAMSEQIDTALVQAALQMALQRRRPEAGCLHHSDQGSQYTSQAYLAELANQDSQISMSGVGNCFDNAAMESFWGSLKAECAGECFPTRAQARTAIFEYIEVWYNRQRLHSTLGYLSPEEFEAKAGH